MEKETINSIDDELKNLYYNLLINNTLTDNEFCHLILDTVTQIFHVSRGIFWLKHSLKDEFIAVSTGLNKALLKDYFYHKYYREDPFYPDNLMGNTAKVLTVSDIMSKEAFYSSDFYNKCLKPYQLYNPIVIYLRNEKSIIGAITLMSTYNEGDYLFDYGILETAVSKLSKITVNYIKKNNDNEKKYMLEMLSNQSPIGILAFVSFYPYDIHYMNASFKRYASDILAKSNTYNIGQTFIDKYIACSEFEQYGFCNTIISSSSKKYCLNVIPCQMQNNNALLKYAYIIPQCNQEENQNVSYLQNNTNLTSRRIEIIKLVLLGCSNREIAEKMFISIYTVKAHLNAIFKEFNVTSRLELCSKLTVKSKYHNDGKYGQLAAD